MLLWKPRSSITRHLQASDPGMSIAWLSPTSAGLRTREGICVTQPGDGKPENPPVGKNSFGRGTEL